MNHRFSNSGRVKMDTNIADAATRTRRETETSWLLQSAKQRTIILFR